MNITYIVQCSYVGEDDWEDDAGAFQTKDEAIRYMNRAIGKWASFKYRLVKRTETVEEV